MSVYYAPPSGGSNPLGILGTLFSFIPGMQTFGAGLGALGAAMRGDAAGTAMSLGGMAKQPTPQQPAKPPFQWQGYQPQNESYYLDIMRRMR